MITPLRGSDILRKVPHCRFVAYQNMHKITSINRLLPKCVILYQPNKRMGHFCCVFVNSEGINFFDPIGLFIDDELNLMSDGLKKELHHDYSYLTKLLYEASKTYNVPIIYNEYKLQGKNSLVCGHWCTLRLLYSDIPNDEFYSLFKNIKNKDKFIAKLYSNV